MEPRAYGLRLLSMRLLALLAVVVALAGCGSGQGAGTAERCFGGGIYDWSASEPGEATPGAAVRTMADGIEAAIAKELETIPANEERDRRLAQDRAAVRGLRALQSAADAAEGAGVLKATAEEGDVVAEANLYAAPAGGYLITTLNAEADCEGAG